MVTPDRVESRLGVLEFKDGVPSKATTEKLFDNLDFTYAYRTFMDNMRGVSIHTLRDGLRSVGVKENEVIVFSDLMDAKSLFLTANADTIYVMGYLDLSKGPVVVETPPKFLGTVQDAWFRWIVDLGLPGPDRGEGGKYLIVPPDYKGQLPDGRYFIGRARTNTILWFGRSFLEDHKDPKPVAETIRKFTKVYPYEPGGVGTPISDFLAGKAKLGRVTAPPPTVFHEGSGKVMNTLPPNDWTFYEMLNEVVQKEPATSLDAELMGPVAAIGIVKGEPFAPDARMKKIMTEALALANATSRALFMVPRDPSWFYYPNSSWFNFLFMSGYEFETPIPEITREGVKPFRATGYRTMDDAHQLLLRGHWHHASNGDAPAWHRLAISAGDDRCGTELFRRRQDLQSDAAQGHPGRELLVVHGLRQHDSLDARHAAALSARRQPERPVASGRGGRRRLRDHLLRPDTARRSEARQLDTNRSEEGLVHDPAPLQPA
ncbi:hypothetical protein CI1B_74730 [Bradyrhizobium ivorense]|uniref:DUF1254 domain-containing protein n=1 Tax=Bradyrhizobium ivorense TaxID=2511166 RepID=A0A508TWJ6_9BRAD|nr:hypothetical protein CI1B_74730 [Bradyrhizobium ivorense]